VSVVVTLAPSDGGLACQVVSAALTVCRRLPAPLEWWEAALGVVALGACLCAVGLVAMSLDERRNARFERGRRRDDGPPMVPFIHFPNRTQPAAQEREDNGPAIP
jgi:hypothetical protein